MPLANMPSGGVLALDLSRTTGWAYGPIDAVNPACGSWHLPSTGGEGARFAAFENVLCETLDAYQPAKMLLEAPLALPGHNSMQVSCQQFGLRALAYVEAYRASCAVSEIGATNVRQALLGQAWFAKDQVKKIVVAYCRRRGALVRDHNAADAVMVWWWYQGQLRGAPKLLPGPLFQIGAT